MQTSICIPTLKKGCIEIFEDKYEVLFSNKAGVGAARSDLAKRAKGDLIVMLDDDVVCSEDCFNFIYSKTVSGQFCMAKVDGHVSSRVFSILASDYALTSGFNPEIKYVFEDGAFYFDALKHGLKCNFVPSDLYFHKPHLNRTGDKRWFRSWFEHTKMLVKYKRLVYPNIVGFFGLRSLLKEPHVFTIKVIGILYWLVRRKNI